VILDGAVHNLSELRTSDMSIYAAVHMVSNQLIHQCINLAQTLFREPKDHPGETAKFSQRDNWRIGQNVPAAAD